MSEITIRSAKEAARALDLLGRVAGAVQVAADRGHAMLTAVDPGHMCLRVRLRAGGTGAATLPLGRLRAAVAPLGGADPEVVLGIEAEHVAVRSEGCTVRIARGDDAVPWAPLEVGAAERVAAGPFFAGLGWVLPAVSTDATRRHIGQVVAQGGRICGTDEHRLHVAPGGGPGWAISRAAAEVLHRMAGGAQVLIAAGAAGVRFQVGGMTLEVGRPEEAFPPVDKIIPGERGGPRATGAAGALQRACTRYAKMSGARTPCAALRWSGGTLELADLSPAPEVVVTVPAVGEASGGPVGVNVAYLADAVRGLDAGAPVRLDLAPAQENGRHVWDPILVRAEGRLAVIMPMRI